MTAMDWTAGTAICGELRIRRTNATEANRVGTPVALRVYISTKRISTGSPRFAALIRRCISAAIRLPQPLQELMTKRRENSTEISPCSTFQNRRDHATATVPARNPNRDCRQPPSRGASTVDRLGYRLRQDFVGSASACYAQRYTRRQDAVRGTPRRNPSADH